MTHNSVKLKVILRCFLLLLVIGNASCNGFQRSKEADQALINSWLGKVGVTTTTSYTLKNGRLLCAAITGRENLQGAVGERFYYPAGVRFKIIGIEVNRSGFSGYSLSFIVSVPSINEGQSLFLYSRNWASLKYRELSFEEQLTPEGINSFFINNPKFRLEN